MTARPCPGTPTLRSHPYTHPAARVLLERLHAEQMELYGFADHYTDTPAEEFDPPHGTFVIAYLNGHAVACGGCRRYDAHTAEIKRMYVEPAARGHGIGRAVLHRLEQHALTAGATAMLLETGRSNRNALALYTAAGYSPIPPYAPGRNPDVNRALRKELGPGNTIPSQLRPTP
ncbi:GNAT family N-acetyltransferase [Streptomyces roseifaciens]|uniref:GNAT family N-acetyltransferase n=1 Tax=Streptomyces roseifaciens TaxID=1488406 RepID=UPI000717F332|nr:GNAT family N-acetyltransferase [Streptomyces roseifaciens]